MGSFGVISEYDAATESWSQYTERLEQFFVANEISDGNRQRAIFLTVIGPSTYALLRNLLSPAAPTAKSLRDLIEILNSHFDPIPSEIVERYKFNTRIRSAGESVSNFVAELRRLAKYCNFGAALDEMLRDRIVCGIQDEAIQRKLLSENKLTLPRATEIALAMETAARDANNLRNPTAKDVNKIELKRNGGRSKQEKFQPTAAKSNGLSIGICYRCGDKYHQSRDCRFKNATCNFCAKIGHIAKVCKAKQTKKATVVHNLQIPEEAEVYTLYNVRAIGKALPAAEVCCTVQGKPVTFEVDSGAPYTLMPFSSFVKIKRYLPPLEPTNIKLQSFTEHCINILGCTQVEVTFNNNCCSLPLLIVEQGSVNLAGRNWIYPLKLMSVFNELDPNRDSQNVSFCNSAKVTDVKVSIQLLLDKFKDLFSPKLGRVKDVKVHLTKKPDVSPKFFKARPVPYALKKKVEEEIVRLMEEGILEPVKTAEFAAPIVPVLKPDGRIRICGDFKLTTNKATELEKYPLPRIDDVFAQLSGGNSFSKLDLRDAYCQLQLDEESKDLVVINTIKGLLRYTSLPFGVASAPAIFQREMEKILQGLNAHIYLDDMLVTGKNDEEHLENLNEVFKRLQEAGIKLHPGKCEFMKESVEYLGHRIDKHGLHPVEAKVEAIVNAPDPKNVDELRSFIGLITYYAKFLPNMATLLAPLYKLLENKQTWRWESKEKEAFTKIKQTLQNSSLLVHFDNNKEVVLACDASPYGLGAVLSHETVEGDRPIAFASRTLSKAEKNYSHIEKETLALVFGVTKFRNYLLGRTFTLLTDHRPLVSLLSEEKPVPTVAAARIQRWALTLSAYSYKIKFRKGKLHGNADACSRLPLEVSCTDSPEPSESVLLIRQLDDSPITRHLIATELEKCPSLTLLRSHIVKGWPQKVIKNLHPFWQFRNELSVDEDIIFRGSRVFIPPKFRNFVLDELHSAHQGISAIKALARSYVWWPGIDKDLEMKVKRCAICQLNASAPPAEKVSWPMPDQPWERLHIDHAGPVEGKMLLIVVDAKTKWLEVIPVPSTSSAATITVLRNLFARFGLPNSIVSDNGAGFCSLEFSNFLRLNGITHIRTAPYHPNSNGLAERAVRTVKSALKKNQEGTFAERLARFLFNYRNTPTANLGSSPSILMFGRSLRCRLDLLKSCVQSPRYNGTSGSRISFSAGEPVWVRNFAHGSKWVRGKVLFPIGKVMFKVQTSWGAWSRHKDQIRHRADSVDVFGEIPSSIAPAAVSADISSNLSNELEGSDSNPPQLSPQVDATTVRDWSKSASSPPELSPPVNVQPPSGGQSSMSKDSKSLRRSVRTKCEPKRLIL